jgi:uncharacterized protein
MIGRPVTLVLHLALQLTGGGQVPSAVPPPVPQRTAACSAIVYATDALVCDDDALREADQLLAGLYAEADHFGVADEAAYIETATAWFRRRSLCAFSADHRDCVVAAYRERSAVMQAQLAVRGRPRPIEITCRNARWRGSWIRTTGGLEAIVLSDENATPIGVALDGGDGHGWRVFLKADSTDHLLSLSREGERIECTQATALQSVPDSGLHDRVESVDALLSAAKAAHAEHRLDDGSYAEVLRWLRDRETAVHAEARLRTFADPIVHNYWHRSRLKFPTVTEQEIDAHGAPH